MAVATMAGARTASVPMRRLLSAAATLHRTACQAPATTRTHAVLGRRRASYRIAPEVRGAGPYTEALPGSLRRLLK